MAQQDQQKAISLYNICGYFTWPASYKTGTFTIGVIGAPGIKTSLEMISQNKTVNGQKIKVVEYFEFEKIEKCHVLFIGADFIFNMMDIIRNPNTKNSLIVSDHPSGISNGSCVNFMFDDTKLLFELSKTNTTVRGLKADPTIESLAYKVY